jgi:PAS domain S-box-containing protein
VNREEVETGTGRDLQRELDEMKARCRELEGRLADSEGTLKAIRGGEVDAIVVSTPEGDRIFTLKGAEEPYRILFEQMNEGAVTTSERGHILYCNQSFADLVKVPLEKVISTPFVDYLKKTERGIFGEMLDRTISGPARDELTFIASDGTVVPVQLSISNLSSGGVVTYCMILADLTERVRAEEALKSSYDDVKRMVEEQTRELTESEARYRSIFEKSLDAILLFDEKGAIVGANPAACRMFAVTEDEVLSMDQDDILSYRPLDMMVFGRSLAGSDRIELDYQRKWGGTFIGETTTGAFTDADGSLVTMLIIRDITERKKAEEALHDSQRNEAARRNELEALVDAVPAMIWISEGIEGTRIIGNETSNEILRQRQDANISSSAPWGCGPENFQIYRDDRLIPAEEQPMQMAARTGQPCLETEFELRFSDGRSVWIYGNAVPLRTEDGRLSGSIGAFIDITERKRIETRLVRSNAELQQFAYVASHDLQEPLRMVISYLGLLEKRYRGQLDDRAREYITIAVDGGRRMKALIDDLLEYSRIDTQASGFSPVDMNEVAAKTLKILELGIRESGAEVTVGDLPTIIGDQTQMIQVVQNLVGNAIKYRSEKPPRINITARTTGKEYVFSVQDNGIGFKMEYADRILKMFQRLHTREEYPGTGVGLAIAKRIVERHGGQLWATSEQGKGSIFYFSIPKPQTKFTSPR